MGTVCGTQSNRMKATKYRRNKNKNKIAKKMQDGQRLKAFSSKKTNQSEFDFQCIIKENNQMQTEERDDFVFQNIQSWYPGNAKYVQSHDQSKKVQQPWKNYPFNTIGRVICVYQDLYIENEEDFPYGTGFIINKRVVITCAHNLYNKTLRKVADFVFFQFHDSQGKKQIIKVKRYGIHKSFFNQNNQMPQNFDIAFLIIQDNQCITSDMTVKLNEDYSFKKYWNNEVLVSGYPKVKFNKKQGYEQYYDSKIPLSQKENYLAYQHSLYEGHCGSPVFLVQNSASSIKKYSLIGIHKGSKDKNTRYCLLKSNFSSNKLLSLIKNSSCEQDITPQDFQFINYRIQALQYSLDKLDIKQHDVGKFYYLNQIYWSIQNKDNKKLQDYLINKINPQSMFAITKQIKQKLSKINEKKLFIKLQVWYDILNKFEHLQLSTQQKIQFFKIWEEFIQTNIGLRKIQQSDLKYCQRIGQTLQKFENKVYFKTKSYTNKNQQKRISVYFQTYKNRNFKKDNLMQKQQKQEQQLQDLIHKIHEILQKATKKMIPSKSLHNQYLNQIRIYSSMKDFSKSQQLINNSQPLTSDNPNEKRLQYEKILFFKGQIMMQMGLYNEAFIYFEQCLNIEESKQTQNDTQLIQILKNMGQIHYYQQSYQQALSLLQRCLQIQNTYLPISKKKQNIHQNKNSQILYLLGQIQFKTMRIEQSQKTFLQIIRNNKNRLKQLNLQSTSLLPQKQFQYQCKATYKLAYLYFFQEIFPKSLCYFFRYENLMIQKYGEGTQKVEQVLSHIGFICQKQKNYEISRQYYQKVLEIKQRTYGTHYHSKQIQLNNIGLSYKFEKNYDKALEYYKKSLEFVENQLGKQAYQCAGILNNIGLLHTEQKLYEEAIGFLKRGAKILEMVEVKNSKDLACIYHNLAHTYSKCQNQALAMQYSQSAYQMRNLVYGKQNEFLLGTRKFFYDLHNSSL